MKKKPVIMATCCLAGSLLVATPVYASPTAGITGAVSAEEHSQTETPVAGVSLTLAKCISNHTVEQSTSVENITSDDKTVAASGKKDSEKKDSESKASKYDNMAVAQVDDFVNIRSKADGDSEIVGKLYGDSVATVVKKVGKWYKIQSGSVTGYVNSDYVVVGDKDLTKSVSTQVATVNTTTLNVRDGASSDSEVVALASDGQKLKVTSLKKADKGWLKVKANGKVGYVSADYVDVKNEYKYAVSAEEEARAAAEKAAKEAEKERALAAETETETTVQETEAAAQETGVAADQAAPVSAQPAPAANNISNHQPAPAASAPQSAPASQNTMQEASSANGTSGTQSVTQEASSAQGTSAAQSVTQEASVAQGTSASQSAAQEASAAQGTSESQSATEEAAAAAGSVQDTSRGQEVADFACQFIGNPYVWGGTSLTNGADCSGFVMSVYAHFGVSLPHSSYGMEGCGRAVSFSEIQPGDIICYGPHVSIYIGNNTVVHASSAETGIKLTSPANYRSIVTIRRIF